MDATALLVELYSRLSGPRPPRGRRREPRRAHDAAGPRRQHDRLARLAPRARAGRPRGRRHGHRAALVRGDLAVPVRPCARPIEHRLRAHPRAGPRRSARRRPRTSPATSTRSTRTRSPGSRRSTAADLDRIVDTRWDPPVTLAVRLAERRGRLPAAPRPGRLRAGHPRSLSDRAAGLAPADVSSRAARPAPRRARRARSGSPTRRAPRARPADPTSTSADASPSAARTRNEGAGSVGGAVHGAPDRARELGLADRVRRHEVHRAGDVRVVEAVQQRGDLVVDVDPRDPLPPRPIEPSTPSRATRRSGGRAPPSRARTTPVRASDDTGAIARRHRRSLPRHAHAGEEVVAGGRALVDGRLASRRRSRRQRRSRGCAGPSSPSAATTPRVATTRLSRIRARRAASQRPTASGSPARFTIASTPSRASDGSGSRAGSQRVVATPASSSSVG